MRFHPDFENCEADFEVGLAGRLVDGNVDLEYAGPVVGAQAVESGI